MSSLVGQSQRRSGQQSKGKQMSKVSLEPPAKLVEGIHPFGFTSLPNPANLFREKTFDKNTE